MSYTIPTLSASGLDALRSLEPRTVYGRLAWIVPAMLFLSSHIYKRASTPSYSKAMKLPQPVLVAHILTSTAELAKYHVQALRHPGVRPVMTPLDAAICLVQLGTSFWIAANHHNVPWASMLTSRATFHAIGIQRIFASGMAMYTGSPRWYEVSVVMITSFIWGRLLIFGPLARGLGAFKERYLAGLIACHLLAMYFADYPHGNAVYVALMYLLVMVNDWAKGCDNFAARALRSIGFATPAEWYEKTNPEVKAQ